MLFWGISFIWSTLVLKYYSPTATIFLRLFFSTVFLIIILFISKQQWRIQKSDRKLFLLSALFSPFLYFIGETYGLQFSSSTITSVVIATIPVFTPIAAYMIFREQLSLLNFLGIFISFIGICFVMINPDFSLNTIPVGFIFLALAVISAIAYSVTVKKLTRTYSPLLIITYQNLIGLIYFLPIFLIKDLTDVITVKVNWELAGSVLALAVFASSLAFLLFVEVIRELGISRANIMANLIPVYTALFSYYLLSEIFNRNKILGILLVITGVIFSQIKAKQQQSKC